MVQNLSTRIDDTGVHTEQTQPGAHGPQTVGRLFLESISNKDLEQAFGYFADDVVMDMPFAPPGSPTRLEGAAALRTLYTGVVSAVTSIDLPVVSSHGMADPEWAVIEYTGEMVQPNGQTYTNHYYGMFHVVDGRIKLLRELYDTYRFAAQISEENRRAMFRTTDSDQG